ncbi:MAG: hypothetical protein ACYS9X_10085 [Planctomycetota bacterium]|jgi:hypothetical protein
MKYSYCWAVGPADWHERYESYVSLTVEHGTSFRFEIPYPDARLYSRLDPWAELEAGHDRYIAELWVGDAEVEELVNLVVSHGDALEIAAERCDNLIWTGRSADCGEHWSGPAIDTIASRFHGASVSGLAVGAMGVFIFALFLRRWLRERRTLARTPGADMLG